MALARIGVRRVPVGLWPPVLDGEHRRFALQCHRQLVQSGAFVVESDADDLGPGELQLVEHDRIGRILDHDDVAEANDRGDHPIESVVGAVQDGQRRWIVGPPSSKLGIELGEHRRVEVGGDVDVGPNLGQNRRQRRQEFRVRRTGRQVQGEAATGIGHLPVSAAAVGTERPDGGAPPPIGLDDTVTAHDRPGRSDSGGADPEVGGDGSDRRQLVANFEFAVGDEPPDGPRNALGVAWWFPAIERREKVLHTTKCYLFAIKTSNSFV